jgi:DNA polymerase
MKLFFDFETRSEVSLTERGRYNYMIDNSFEIILLSYAIDDKEVRLIEFPSPNQLKLLFENPRVDKFIAHNSPFELGCLKRYNINIDINKVEDTMLLSQYYSIPASLDGASRYLNLPVNKLTTGKELIKLFTIPIPSLLKEKLKLPDDKIFFDKIDKPKEFEMFKEYSRIDTEVCRSIYNSLPAIKYDIYPEYRINYMINNKGIKIDKDLVRQAIIDLNEEKERTDGKWQDMIEAFFGKEYQDLYKKDIKSQIKGGT